MLSLILATYSIFYVSYLHFNIDELIAEQKPKNSDTGNNIVLDGLSLDNYSCLLLCLKKYAMKMTGFAIEHFNQYLTRFVVVVKKIVLCLINDYNENLMY